MNKKKVQAKQTAPAKEKGQLKQKTTTKKVQQKARRKPKSTTKFDKALTQVTSAILEGVQEEMKSRAWKLAFLDVRGQLMKLRVELRSGRIIRSLDPPVGVHGPLATMWEINDSGSMERWYGVKITVTPDGESQIDYHRDPNCVRDSTFFDVD